MQLLFEELNKTKAGIVSDEITKVEGELRQSWVVFGFNHFDHVLDFVGYLSIYYEQLPRAETSYIVLMIMNCHFLAADKLVQDDKPHNEVDAKYLSMLSRYYSDSEMEYYRRFYYNWISNVHEEKSLKRHISSIPIVRQFIWIEWRDVNVAMGGLVKQILMLNYPNQDLDVALMSSAITYTSIQCDLLNDVGSFIKDKDSPKINYYIDVSPKKTQDQDTILEASIKYYDTLDLPSNIKLVMKSAVYGSYLMYRLSNRYFGRSQPNW
ncbi:hypothetical protein EDD11_009929 [Mortierella claussenii]|nr:hypothetical protein EDD11_009929 [Mortierella claussenii]